MKKILAIAITVLFVITGSISCFAAEGPNYGYTITEENGVVGGWVILGEQDYGEAIITAEDIPWIIEQGRSYGESVLGLEWNDWKDPNKDYYLGGYDIPATTGSRTKEAVVEGIQSYLDLYMTYGHVRGFYLELIPIEGTSHYTVYVYRG